VVTTTNTPLFNQMVGASSPLLGTNTLPLGNHTVWGSDGVVTAGMTNQWHFYIVTNTGITADYTNAAFITFDPYTLSIPRVGVFADDVTDATRPEADIDLYVSTDPSITNLNPVAISNCLAGVNNSGASLGQGGTEFVLLHQFSAGDCGQHSQRLLRGREIGGPDGVRIRVHAGVHRHSLQLAERERRSSG
jgi:hypothetical protein